jgi:thymidylate synthase (FAD)
MSTNPQQLFQNLQGEINEGFPAINSPTHYSSEKRVPYLTRPGVVVLSKPDVSMKNLAGFLGGFDPSLEFAQYTLDPTELPDATQLCKLAGQLCYMSFGPKRTMNAQAKRYLDNIRSSRHGSVLEHANFSLLLYGISRSVTHELVRHRAGLGFSQVSQRYVSGRTLRFVERPEFQKKLELHTRFLLRIERVAREHQSLLDLLSVAQKESSLEARKKVNQAARALLPNEVEAPIIVTGNVRAWRHIIEERATSHAEPEIRMLALRVFLCLREVDHLLFDDYTIKDLPDGTHEIETAWRKV